MESSTQLLQNATYISPLTDFGFKKIFSDKELLIDILNVLMPDVHIVDLQYQPTEHLGDREEERIAEFDLFCRTDKDKRIIIEMQQLSQDFFIDRALFYSAYPIREQAPKGMEIVIDENGEEKKVPWNYELDPVYFVGILNFSLFKEREAKDIIIEEIELYRKKVQKPCSDKLKMIFVELTKFNKKLEELETKLDMWLYSLKHLPEFSEQPNQLKDPVIEKLFKSAQKSNLTPKEMETYSKDLLKLQNVYNIAMTYRREGEQIGEQRGISIGEQRAEQREREKAHRERIEIAIKLVQNGWTVKDIADTTKLSLEEVKRIVSEVNN